MKRMPTFLPGLPIGDDSPAINVPSYRLLPTKLPIMSRSLECLDIPMHQHETNRLGGTMKFYRLYSGDDDQSHFQELDSSRSSEFFNATRPAEGLLFRKDFSPHIVNWHRAPRRRWVITLSGTVDIKLGDGTSMTFGAGDVFLAEDVRGQGHQATPHNWVRVYVDV
jgi:hypothetical protein